MRSTDKPPTFLPDGMLFEDRGQTKAVWDSAPKPGGVFRLRLCIAAIFLMIGLILVEITVPAIWPVGASLLSIWLIARTLIPKPRTVHNTLQKPSERVTARYMQTYDRDGGTSPGSRIGDAERDRVISELGIHFAAGRLDHDEYDERTTRTLSAKRAGELAIALYELPLLTREEREILP